VKRLGRTIGGGGGAFRGKGTNAEKGKGMGSENPARRESGKIDLEKKVTARSSGDLLNSTSVVRETHDSDIWHQGEKLRERHQRPDRAHYLHQHRRKEIEKSEKPEGGQEPNPPKTRGQNGLPSG